MQEREPKVGLSTANCSLFKIRWTKLNHWKSPLIMNKNIIKRTIYS